MKKYRKIPYKKIKHYKDLPVSLWDRDVCENNIDNGFWGVLTYGAYKDQYTAGKFFKLHKLDVVYARKKDLYKYECKLKDIL